MSQQLKALELLRQAPQPLSALRSLCHSRKATINLIYRLREAGHLIETTTAKSAKGETTYTLKREAGSLADHIFPEEILP